MICRYNRRELMTGIACCAASILGYGCAYVFFRFVPMFVLKCCGIPLSPAWMGIITLVCLLIITISGYRLWRRNGGFSSYYDSGLYHELDLSSGGGVMVDFYAHRVTGPAYVLSQIFLAGPLMFLRGITHFRNRISRNQQLEQVLHETLSMLREIHKWQSLSDHPGLEREILLLAKMGEIDFSNARGPRFKASGNAPNP